VAGSEYLIVGAAEGMSGSFDLSNSTLPSLAAGLYWGGVAVENPNGSWHYKLVVFEPFLSVGLEIVQVDESTSVAIFNFYLDNAELLTQNVLVDYATVDGTATAGDDYVAASGTLTFSPLQTSKTVQVTIIDDWDMEDLEDFFMQLSNGRLQGGGLINILYPAGIGEILDDDFEEEY
jgi:hypothetical protein